MSDRQANADGVKRIHTIIVIDENTLSVDGYLVLRHGEPVWRSEANAALAKYQQLTVAMGLPPREAALEALRALPSCAKVLGWCD